MINLSEPLPVRTMSAAEMYRIADELAARRRHPSHARFPGLVAAIEDRLSELRNESARRFAEIASQK